MLNTTNHNLVNNGIFGLIDFSSRIYSYSRSSVEEKAYISFRYQDKYYSTVIEFHMTSTVDIASPIELAFSNIPDTVNFCLGVENKKCYMYYEGDASLLEFTCIFATTNAIHITDTVNNHTFSKKSTWKRFELPRDTVKQLESGYIHTIENVKTNEKILVEIIASKQSKGDVFIISFHNTFIRANVRIGTSDIVAPNATYDSTTGTISITLNDSCDYIIKVHRS